MAHDKFGDVLLCVFSEDVICYPADASMGCNVMDRRRAYRTFVRLGLCVVECTPP